MPDASNQALQSPLLVGRYSLPPLYSPGHLVPHSRVQPLGSVPRNILKFFITIAAFYSLLEIPLTTLFDI